MDEIDYEEIVSILAMHGRPDLIQSLAAALTGDPDWRPDFKDTIQEKKDNKESYEYDSGSAEEEDLEVEVDSEGFHSIKD